MSAGKTAGERTWEQVHRLVETGLDLLFPPRCASCGIPGSNLCADCRATFEPLGSCVCDRCAEPLPAPGLCVRCLQHPPCFERVLSAFLYEGALREAVLAFKYKGRRGLTSTLADAMAVHVQPDPAQYHALLAVPMHPERERERGYNHAALLAMELARHWGIPLLPAGALRRARPTDRQVGQDYQARWQNVAGAFIAQGVEGKSVLVVDDVCTTGATLNACSEALRAAGARLTAGATLARARLHP